MRNIQWLKENGGPAIQLRLSAIQNSGVRVDENVVSALLAIDNVQKFINYFDAFQMTSIEINPVKQLEYLIHYYKDTCLEKFFPRIMDFGFREGIGIFDEKMSLVANTFKYVYSIANNKTNQSQRCYNYSIQLHKYFYMSDCLFPEVIQSMEKRLNAIHKAAKERIFDIYQDDSKLPKKPEIWRNYGVLKDEINPWKIDAEKPLSMFFDIWTLAYYADKCVDPEKIKKINDIIEYILTPEFQKFAPGHLLYVKAIKRYHVNGLNLTLPFYEIEGNSAPQQSPPYTLEILDIMSHFETARKSKWFNDCLNYFEQFKTEKGTYLFPEEYLHKQYNEKAFLSEKNVSLKRDERSGMKREIVSTMKIAEIYGRIS